MEFLVRSEVRFPLDLDKETHDAIMVREIAMGRQLLDNGNIKAVWRVIGRRASITVFEAADANAMHEILINLPVFPYLTIESIEPLVTHPSLALVQQQRDANP